MSVNLRDYEGQQVIVAAEQNLWDGVVVDGKFYSVDQRSIKLVTPSIGLGYKNRFLEYSPTILAGSEIRRVDRASRPTGLFKQIAKAIKEGKKSIRATIRISDLE